MIHQRLHDTFILPSSKAEEKFWVAHRALKALAEIKCNNYKNSSKENI